MQLISMDRDLVRERELRRQNGVGGQPKGKSSLSAATQKSLERKRDLMIQKKTAERHRGAGMRTRHKPGFSAEQPLETRAGQFRANPQRVPKSTYTSRPRWHPSNWPHCGILIRPLAITWISLHFRDVQKPQTDRPSPLLLTTHHCCLWFPASASPSAADMILPLWLCIKRCGSSNTAVAYFCFLSFYGLMKTIARKMLILWVWKVTSVGYSCL